MNYKLAKQLKEVGFPQAKNSEGKFNNCEHGYKNTELVSISMCDCEYPDTAYFPTLSELIEACGDRFDSLEKDGDIWWVNSDKEIYVDGGSTNDCLCTSGKTPEEAVANLWLELNK